MRWFFLLSQTCRYRHVAIGRNVTIASSSLAIRIVPRHSPRIWDCHPESLVSLWAWRSLFSSYSLDLFSRLFWHNHWPICHTQNIFSVKFSWKTDEKIGNQSSAALLFFNISYYLLKGLATLNQFQVKFALDVVCPRHYLFFKKGTK
jgi:hypothetical protein